MPHQSRMPLRRSNLYLFLLLGAAVILEMRNHAHPPSTVNGLPLDAYVPIDWSGSHVLYLLSYAWAVLPFLFAGFRSEVTAVRRYLFALFALIGTSVLVPPGWLPCLQIAVVSFSALTTARWISPGPRFALILPVAIVGLNSLALDQHGLIEAASGIVVGGLTYIFANSSHVKFLDSHDALATIRAEIQERQAVWRTNAQGYWNDSYLHGHWSFLDSMAQRPRYYAIAGVVRDRFSEGAAMLDVGCGEGVLYPHVAASATTYRGIDVASGAIDTARRSYGQEHVTFQTTKFENLGLEEQFDVVVLNEVLYYFPLGHIEPIFCRARKLLRDERSVVIVSLCRNVKARLVYRCLRRMAQPLQVIRTQDGDRGSYWTILVFARSDETSAPLHIGNRRVEG